MLSIYKYIFLLEYYTLIKIFGTQGHKTTGLKSARKKAGVGKIFASTDNNILLSDIDFKITKFYVERDER